MCINVEQIDKKYFELLDRNNKQYRIYLRNSKNRTPSFSLCIIEEVSPTKSISYKKTFLVDEFNYYVEGYKKFENIQDIQDELIANIKNKYIEITQLDDSTKLVNIILNKQFQLSLKLLKAHEIYESNELMQRNKSDIVKANFVKNRALKNENNLKNLEEENKNTEIKLENLKSEATRLFNLFNKYKKIQEQKPKPPIIKKQGPSEAVMLTLTKEERYRILGIKSDIVHTVNELFYISHWLSQEKATKLDLLFKGPFYNFDSTTFHSTYDNIVPCLILIEATNGARFGGFTNQTWKGENEYKKDNTAFLFSLNFLEKYPVKPECAGNAIFAKISQFFTFGKGDLIIYNHCNQCYCKSEFPRSYNCFSNNGDPRGRLTKYNFDFIVKDLEVFLVSFDTKDYS